MKVLFVCTGNICRSPMAEVIFENLCKKNKRKDVIVKGAGTHAMFGDVMTELSHSALKAVGEKVSDQPRICTRWRYEMLDEFDHIVCMTSEHVDFIDPGKKHNKVYTLGSIAGFGDVGDPWGYSLDTYVDICKQLQGALEILYDKICKI